MKKILLSFVALFAMVSMATAQRAWAYDLELTPSVDSYTFAFKAVTAGDATLVFYKEGAEAGTLNLGSISAGDNTVTKTSEELLGAIQQSGDFNWGVKMTGSAIGLNAKGFTLEVTDVDRGIYNFYLPQGVAVDNNPESSTFGKIYIAEATDGAPDGGSDRADNQKRGIFVYDQTLAELNPTNKGIIPSNVTLADASRQAMHRIAVNPVNGHVAFAYNIAGSTAVWSVDPNDLAGAATDLIAGLGITKANSICFDENGVLYVMDNGNTTNGGTLVKVENGTLTKIVQNAIWGVEDNSIVSDGRGGIWIAQNRSGIDAYAVLSHVNAAGAIDFKVTNASATALKDLFPTANGNASYRGQCAYNTREDLLAFGGNYRSSVYKVTYDAETGIPSLALSYRTPYLSKNIDGLAFDYAGDLYLLSASAERFYKYSAPTNNNTCTVPAKKAQVITLVSATPEYNVTINVNGNGTVTGANTGTYLEGTELTLTATPEEHYEFTGWTGDVSSTENPLTIPVDGDKNITANFAKKQYTLTVLTNDENKGTVTGAGTYDYGTVVTIEAIAQAGYKLLYWSDRSKELSRTITMNKNEALSAYFVKEYAVEPTFTIEKVWENAQVPAATGDGFQAVGWDQKIYMQNKTAGKIQVFSNGTDATVDYATSGTGQQIAVDEAGNLIVFNAYFATSTPNSVLIYKKGDATGTAVSFTLQDPARCDFFSASGDIYSSEGGCIYFYCNGKTVINRLKIANGAATASDITTDVVGGSIYQTGSNQNHVIVDIFGNLVTHARSNSVDWINVYTNECAKFTLPSIKLGTLGGCSFELGGKELWAYHAGATNYSSEWNLYNMTDGKFLSDTILYAVDKTNSTNNACNWLNVQVVDEKTAYIYQFCPKKAVALWKVSLKENYSVSASATNGTVTGTGTYQEGATATLTATPDEGYKFVNWTKGGVEVSTEATYSFPVTENVELVANFEALAQYKINAHADHTSHGYVTGGGDYYEGKEVTLEAVAKSAYYFTQWNDGNTDNPRTITVSGEAEYIAEFAEAHPRAWAYDMKLGEDGDNYTFTFKATAAGQATITFKDKDGNALAQPASQTIAAVVGENKFTIAKNAFAAGVDAFWSITMDGDPIPAIAEVTDQTRGIYDFYNMMGVVVDNNTDSKDFGKIYVQMSLEGTTQGKAQTPGLFLFDQKLDGLNSDPNVGVQPSLPAEYTIGGDRNKFHRLNIDPSGNLVFSYNIANQPAVFAINREDMTTTNLLTGVVGFTRTAAHCFDAEGTLYVMDIANNQGRIYRVKDGGATPMTEATGKLVNASIAMESDGKGGLWVSHNRGQMDAYYQLAHIASNGDIDWFIDSSNPQGFEGSSSRGALAYDVERQILAQGRNGKVELYTVSYEPTITLTPLLTIASNDLGNNIDGLAFDYAGDLYVVNSSKEKFQKFTLPTAENICTVAAPALEAVRFTPVYTVSVASNNNEWGIANGGGTYEENETATLSATPATNYEFVNWTKEGAEVSTENPYTFAVTESATYVANFVEKTKYTVDATPNDPNMGTVTGDGSYYEGTEVTLTATAKGGYVFVDWSDGVTEETRTIDELTGDVNLTANFKVAVPRAWAYDLRLDADTDPVNYMFTFKTTSAGTATLIFKDEDGNIHNFGTHTATATEAGEQTITIAKTVFDAATKDIYWEVELAGEAIAKIAELTDPTKGIYNFYVPQGVAVDNSPNSMYFGRIYVAEGTTGGNDGLTEMAKQMTAGLFVYNQALEKVQPATGYTGIIPQNVTFNTNKPTSTDEINNIRQQMHRVAVDPVTGEVVFAYYKDGATAVYGMNPDNLAGNARNYLVDNQITYAQSLCFDEDGALYVMNNANAGQTGGQIYKVQNGEVALFAAHDKNNQWAVYDNALAADGRGGLWIAQNRYGYDYPILSHVNKNGEVDFAVKENLNGWFPNNNTGSSYRGQLAYNLNENILAFAGNKMVTLFTVAYDGNGKPTLNKLMSTPLLGGGNIDGVAFDYAGDLYVASASAERLYKFVVPITDNICTVPAPESQIIMKEARYTVTVVADPAEMGTVTEGGEYKAGEKVTLTATANTDYRFINWTIGSDVISTEASFEYTVPAENVTITAHFELKPLAMVGVVKRAVQIGESTVVLTHDNGTPHLYKVVDGELEAEISQVGVEAAAAGYLSISDIAATEDGKLVACNYVQTTFGGSNLATFYMWNNLTANPSIWFQSSASSNSATSDQGYTMAVTGTSTNANILVTGLHNTHRGVRMSHFSIIDGKYIDTSDGAVSLPYYYYIGKKFKGASAGVDAAVYNETTHGVKFQLNASPLATENWIIDAELMEPSEFTNPQTYGQDPIVNANIADNTLGKKFNGATYLTVLGKHLMVAPYADGENVAGVKIIDITNGLATAQELETRNITTPQAATAAATAVEVDGTNLRITLVADATIYTFAVALESSVTIDENADNTTALENYDGEVVTATVKRNFEANKYLTLTLPFDMNATQIRNVFGNATVYALSNVVEYNAEEVHLQFSPEPTITAGKPYILKTAASGYDAEDGFTIEGVAIDLSSRPVTSGDVTMVPVLDAGGTLNQPDEYFLSNNALYCAGTYPREIMGLRAYFESASPLPIRARVVFQDNAATSIPMVETQPANQVRKVLKDGQLIIIRGEEMYNMQGQRME